MQMKVKGRLAGLALIGFAFVTTNALPDATALASLGNPQARASTQASQTYKTAQSTLPLFLQSVLDADGKPVTDASIRISHTGPDGKEHAKWVSLLTFQHGVFVGKASEEGELTAFTAQQVLDWTFPNAQGKYFGNFTARKSLTNIPANHAVTVSAQLTSQALPADWRSL